jgi:hypothetical protein
MRKVNLNVVLVCGSTNVELSRFSQLTTESYLPNISIGT